MTSSLAGPSGVRRDLATPRIAPERALREDRATDPAAPRFLAVGLDPSLTATGWAVVELTGRGRLVDAGVIRNAPAKNRLRVLEAEDDARRGLEIRRALALVLERHRPIIAVQEANAGSRSAKAAGALHRAQQACVNAVDADLGGLPIFVTAGEAKRRLCGKRDAPKSAVERAVIEHFGREAWAVLQGVAPSKRENAYDAAAVVLAAWDQPEIAALRRVVGTDSDHPGTSPGRRGEVSGPSAAPKA